MYDAAYLLSSTGIRYDGNGRHEMLWLPKSAKSSQKKLNPQIIAERADIVFQLMPERMKNLVIVNGNLENFEAIQACVKVAEKYANIVTVIPPLLARLTYAIADISRQHKAIPDETILVVTINHAFIDFVILQRNENFELNIIYQKMLKQQRNIFMDEFARIYDYYDPHATVILAEDNFIESGERIRDEFNPRNFFSRHYKRWDYLLMFGSLLKAIDYDQRYSIPNFSNGIETSFRGRGSSSNVVLLPEPTKIPCKIYGCVGRPCSTTLCYFPEHYEMFDSLVYESKEASKEFVWIEGSPNQIIGYYDDRGVPYLTANNDKNEHNDTVEDEETESISNSSEEIIVLPEPVEPIFSMPKQPKEASSITFKFEDKHCAVEIYQNKMTQKIRDSNGNEWTPLYLSMADGKPEIGRKAKSDYQRFPKYVIYDVLKIIGKPLNQIEIDPKWGFELVEKDGIVYFQIETPSGPRLIPQEIVISAFIKAMKLRIESFWGAENEFNGFHLSTNFILLKSQKSIFEKAAAKNCLNILSFVVTDSD